MTPFPAANRSTSSLIVVLGFRREKGGRSCFTSDARGSLFVLLEGFVAMAANILLIPALSFPLGCIEAPTPIVTIVYG